MALKITNTKNKEILNNNVSRLDASFYVTQFVINNFFARNKYVYLDEIKEYYANGLEFRDFERGQNTPYIRVSDIKQPFLNIQAIKFVEKRLDEVDDKYKIDDHSLLLSRSGNVGVACFPDYNAKKSIISSHIIKIKLKERYNPFLISTIINSKIGKLQIFSLINGQLIKEINRTSLSEFRIPILKNEERITERILKSLNNHEKSLSILEQAQSLFYQKLGIDFSKIQKEKTFSVNLSDFVKDDLWTPAFSYPLYVNTLKEIQKKWQTVPLGEIATVKKGDEVGSDNYNKYLDKKDSDIPFIRTSDLVNYEVDQFPDFYIPEEIYQELMQDVKAGDVLFTKDGKIGMSAMITKNDKSIIASGMVRLRLKSEAKKYNLTPEYLFIVLSLKETGFYPAIRRTVIASTIPHLREERLREIEIPILDKNSIDEITKLVKEAFELKDEKKKLIKEVREEIDSYFDI